MNRRTFIQRSSAAATLAYLPLACSSETTPHTIDVVEVTIADLQAGMESGEFTSRAIVESYLQRIEEVDQQGPTLRSVIEVNSEALSIADQRDEERKQGQVRGPLHGIPVMIKDNIDTADQMETTAGSLALVGSKPIQDAFLVQQLREAGAVLLGKTNLSEWANFRSTRSSSGWSGRGGQVKNPYVLDRNPCGSSSGSGVAVSANLCTVAIGTETNGSIVCPSQANGIVGIKPTVGLVSRSGIIPISHSQDTAGPMTRTVTDAAILLSALTGTDARDPITQESEGKVYQDYTQFLDADGLQGKRIGVGRSYFGFHEVVDKRLEAALAAMKEQGATLIDLETVMPQSELSGAGYEVLLYEFKYDLNQYLAERNHPTIKTLEDLIRYNKEHSSDEMPYFQQEIFESAQEKGGLDEGAYQEALAKVQRVSRQDGIDKVMNEHNLDAIAAPSGSAAWPIDVVNGDHFLGGSSSPAAMAGYPSVTVPAGFVHGLPVGISFFASAYQEPQLIQIAYAFEQATRHRRTPGFKDTLAESSADE
ncbi:amidase [Tunicatimonas pelagia]|uniref:amidase n=1 Tax=Tunicatimonas pelagia TaxID=931531 RepID=UPI002665B4C8|nr:amidase [Tunicatimonas pelagia]WKN41710.1 amidase [Tunicatimonas pelagia]